MPWRGRRERDVDLPRREHEDHGVFLLVVELLHPLFPVQEKTEREEEKEEDVENDEGVSHREEREEDQNQSFFS